MAKDLTQKAMLVRLNISQWTARKHDKAISQEVADRHGANQDSGRYNKTLIAHDAIKKINKMVNEARGWHYKNTLPWLDDGARILPAANFDAYSQQMRDFRHKFDSIVMDFVSAYPELKNQASLSLNGMFKEEDYPPVDQIKSRYSFRVQIDPLPASQDFRVDLSDEEAKRIQAQIQERADLAQAHAMQDLWDRLYQTVSHMAEKLAKSDAVFRNSLVENVQCLVNLLPRLNLTGDSTLEKMRQQIEDKLCAHGPDTLREDKRTRRETANEAQSILNAMAGYMGG